MLLNHYWAIEPNYGAQLLARMRALDLATARPQAGPAADAEDRGLPIEIHGNVAVVRLMGPMYKRVGWFGELFGLADTMLAEAAVRSAAADPDIGAIMLLIDSPGGSIDGLYQLGDAVYEARRAKPVIAQAQGMIASAAYWVASQADEIYAQRGDMIGSIGVRLMLYDYSGFFEEAGVRAIPVDSSPADRPFKSAGAFGTPITDEQVADFQRLIDGHFADFRAVVLRGRPKLAANFDAVADGRVWLADEAQSLGLIDGVQQAEDTLADLLATVAENGARRERLTGMKLANMARGI